MRIYTKKLARLRDKARELAGEIGPAAAEIDREDMFPPELLGRLWDAGFMTLTVPKGFGGGDQGLTEASAVVEELARGSGAAALLVLLQCLGVGALRDFAREEQAGELLKRVVDERMVTAFALSEPEPAPGEKPRVTTAKKRKDKHVITGKKTFVSGARESDLVVVFAVTNPKSRIKKALSAFVTPTGARGMLPGRELPKSGLRGVPAVEIALGGVEVPEEQILGGPGTGYEIARTSIYKTAPLAAALSSGLLAEALGHTLSRAREQKDDLALSEFQPMGIAFAEISGKLDLCRSLAWAAAGAVAAEAPEAERLAREAKWMATEAATDGIDQAARLQGIGAAVKGSLLERLSRDARAAQLLLGPNHIHKMEVAGKLLRGK